MTARTLALSDPLIVESISGVDRLTTLFDAHHQRLYRLARRLSANADDARDLVQDTFVRAAERVATIPVTASSEEAWLVRVLINLCRDRWRRRSVRVRANAYEARNPTVPSGETALIARATIWGALQLLSPRRRAIVIMCELEGLAITSVAATLGLRPVTVRWHLARARRDLARVIQE